MPTFARLPIGRVRRQEAALGLLLAGPVIVVIGGLVLYPLLLTIWDSLHRIDPMRAGQPFVGLRQYRSLFADPDVQASWSNTLWLVVLAVTAETIGGVAVALLLDRIRWGRKWLIAAVLLPWAMPPVVNAIIWLWIYNPSYGLLNAALRGAGVIETDHVWFNDRTTALVLIAVVHVWRTMPLTVVIVLAALQSLPASLIEAAKLDGAGPWQCFRAVTLPLIAPALVIAMTQSTINAFNLFDEAWILAGASLDSRTLLIETYMLAFQDLRFSAGMALSVLVMIASLAVSLVYILRSGRSVAYE